MTHQQFIVYRPRPDSVKIPLKKGAQIKDFRGETWTFEGCTHERKINVSTDSGKITRQFFPNVFGLVIIRDANVPSGVSLEEEGDA